MRSFRSSYACAKFHPDLCSPFVHSVVSNDSVIGHRRPCSDCVNALAYLGLRCPHMPEDTFSLGAAQMGCLQLLCIARVMTVAVTNDPVRYLLFKGTLSY